MGFKKVETIVRHQEFQTDLNKLLRKYCDRKKLSAQELLALASQTVGAIIACQDQRKVTPEQAMSLVQQNINEGNRMMIEKLLHGEGGSA